MVLSLRHYTEGAEGIPLSQILKMEMPRDFDFNIKHLGTLWELDKCVRPAASTRVVGVQRHARCGSPKPPPKFPSPFF